VLGYFSWNAQQFRSPIMAHQLDALRIAERSGGSLRGMNSAMLLAGIFGAIASFWALLHLAYIYGASARMNRWLGVASDFQTFTPLINTWIPSQQGFNISEAFGVVLGLVLGIGMLLMRARFGWWPFHPIGYAMGGLYWVTLLWLPLMVSWLVKTLVLRYGGLRVYRAWLMPLGFGLILGDFLSGSFWALWASVAGAKLYSFFP